MNKRKCYGDNPKVRKALNEYKEADEKLGNDCCKTILVLLSEQRMGSGGFRFFTGFGKNCVHSSINHLLKVGYIKANKMGRFREFELTEEGQKAAMYLIDNKKYC